MSNNIKFYTVDMLLYYIFSMYILSVNCFITVFDKYIMCSLLKHISHALFLIEHKKRHRINRCHTDYIFYHQRLWYLKRNVTICSRRQSRLLPNWPLYWPLE